MRATAADYLHQLQQLLPQGAAWPRDADAVLTRLLAALADELARVHNRAVDLLDEADPRTVAEMLDEWETTAGLPDTCTEEVDTLAERRAVLHAKWTSRGGASPQFFVDLAAALGFAVTIEEYQPFRAGQNAAGDPLLGEDWAYAWTVHAPETTVTEFRAGQSAAGDPLRDWGNELLECAIRRLAPAHTIPIFAYGG